MPYEEWKRKFVEGSETSADKNSNALEQTDTKFKGLAEAEAFSTNGLQYYKLVEPDGEPVEINHRGGAVTARPILGYDNVYVSEKLLNHKSFDGKRLKPKELHEIVQSTNEARKFLNIKDSDNIPKIIIADGSEFVGAVAAAYNPVENALFINKSINQIMQVEEYFKQMAAGQNELSIYVHELIHWKDAEEYRKAGKPLKNYMKWLNEKCRIKLDKLVKKGYNIDNISGYASKMLDVSRYDEVYTEYRVLQIMQEDGNK